MKRVFLPFAAIVRLAREFGYGVHAAHALRHGVALDATTAQVVSRRTRRRDPRALDTRGRRPDRGVWEGPVVLPPTDAGSRFDGPRF